MRFGRGWETLASAFAAMAAGVSLSGDFYDKSSGEIVTLLSLVMAAVIPTMILSVTSMRSSNLSVKEIRSLSLMLNKQISLFAGLFFYSLLASICVIYAKASRWPNFGPFHIVTAIVTFFLVFLVLRSFSVIFSVKSLLVLATRLAEDDAIMREKIKLNQELADYKTPEKYGTSLEDHD